MDIVNWDLEVFGREADDLIRQIVRLGGSDALEQSPLDLAGLDPRYFPGVDIPELQAKLYVLRDEGH
jgi:hypothetical protein